MQFISVRIALLCLVACIIGTESFHDIPRQPTFPTPRPFGTPPFNPKASLPNWRFRRSPQGSVGVSGVFTEHQRPQMSVDYQHQIINDGRRNLNAYGGVQTPDLRHFTPHAGVNYEWNPNKNTFLKANGGFQQGPRGGISPNFGATFGMRFRRDAEELNSDMNEEQPPRYLENELKAASENEFEY
ncbi:hypothetical protein PV326_006366 [Microctonus aethiopoides]|nr:hypothetical protein PV326_006366 [Microctonus aethiopoides]